MENIAFTLICWICASIFTGVGIYALKKKTPMHFWSGTTVKSEDVTNVVEYNKENSKMWIIYSAFFWMAGFFNNSYIGVIIISLSALPGVIFLILNYKRIEKKYLVKYSQK